MIKILKSKLVILLEYQNIKVILQKANFQIGLKRCLWLKTLKTLCRGDMLLVIWRRNSWIVLQIRIAKDKSKRVFSSKCSKEKRQPVIC